MIWRGYNLVIAVFRLAIGALCVWAARMAWPRERQVWVRR